MMLSVITGLSSFVETDSALPVLVPFSFEDEFHETFVFQVFQFSNVASFNHIQSISKTTAGHVIDPLSLLNADGPGDEVVRQTNRQTDTRTN